ncbi:MAG: nucleotidyltransferase family protein [Planctomycetes bacterium]|nr:nucleotidyltransferase family protein [Planctomycetota bacterium]
MKALLLGAGYATRLYPLTRTRPKPLLPIGGVTILQRICDQILRIPTVDRIYLVTNHRFVSHYYTWLRDFQESRKPAVPIEIFDDLTTSNDDRLGAIGDIDFVLRHAKVDDDLLVIAGDNLFDFSLTEFVAFGQSKGAAVCVKDVESKELASLYGVVKVDANHRILDFEEKPPVPRATLVAVGVYFFGRKCLALFRQYIEEGQSKDQPGYFVQWLHQKIDLYAYAIPGSWYDIGDIDSYTKANELYLQEGK